MNARIDEAGAAPLVETLLEGGVPAATLLARLILECRSAAELRRLVENASPARASHRRTLDEMSRLLSRHPDAWKRVRAAASMVDHRPRGGGADETLAAIAAGFDRAVAASPVASVALHSLGDEGRLAASTDEIVAWLDALGVLGANRDGLDLGCGIGRFGQALAGRMRHVTGIDVSAGMIRLARRRSKGVANLSFLTTSGRNLADFDAGSFDLVLAVDSFPYLVLAGEDVAERHVGDIARVLKTPGDAVILNFSYRDQTGLDRRDLGRMARRHGLHVAVDGTTPFRSWDGTAFHLVKCDL